MKRIAFQCLAIGTVLLVGATLSVGATKKAQKKMVTGTVTCLYCYASETNMGENPAGCVERCLGKKLMAPIIVEEGTDNVFVCVWKNGEAANEKLVEFAQKKVNAMGPVYEKGGVRVIEIGIVSEAL